MKIMMLLGEESLHCPPLGHFIAVLMNYNGFMTCFGIHSRICQEALPLMPF